MTTHVKVIQLDNSHNRENVFRFLYGVWSDEFCRFMEGMDREHRLMKDALDETAQYFVAVDQSERILGCVRANILGNAALLPDLQINLKTAAFVDLFGAEKIYYVSHLTISPDARGRTVTSLLIGALYRRCLRDGALVGISYCAPHLMTFYNQLGYRPYTGNFRIDAGIRIPIVHCVRDWAYLDEIKSPLVRFCSRDLDDGGAAAGKISGLFPAFKDPAFSRKKVSHLWARLAHTMPNDTSFKKNGLFEGLSEKEWLIVGRRASEIDFAQGEYVYRRGEIEQGMGVLLSGSLGVEVAIGGVARIINVILSGEPFGEISCLGEGRRTFNLVALEKSLAFFLPSNFIDQVSSANTELGLKLSKRLLKTVVGRFSNLADVTVADSDSFMGSEQDELPAINQPPDKDMTRDRFESYRFDSLGDREGEFKRLVIQATIGEKIEFSVLDRVGLRDGATVLDLGSGPGVTSLLVAKQLPKSTIIGVEPEDLLRVKAESLIADQGYSGRCRFVKGSGDRIPLDDAEVDFSYARFLFQHLPNPLVVLDQMRRVTRQDGIVVILDVDDTTNIIYPAPHGLKDLEKRIAAAQSKAGGDRHIGRKLFGYMHDVGLQEVSVEPIPITASALGREAFFSTVYSFKQQVLERAGEFDEQTAALFDTLKDIIYSPKTFAMTTVYVARGIVPRP